MTGQEAPRKLTPMMEQYLEVKRGYPDYILLYRIGDFYECFFKDAEEVSRALSLTLTSRGDNVPLCGIPHHAFGAYVPRLIRQGFKVAVCDQMETPEEAKARGGAKAMIRREITRIITAGTLTEDELLGSPNSNWLMAMVPGAGYRSRSSGIGIALADISTGEFEVKLAADIEEAASIAEIRRPAEIIAPEGALPAEFMRAFKPELVMRPASFFDEEIAAKRIEEAYGTLPGFSTAERQAIGAVLGYIDLTHIGEKPRLAAPSLSAHAGRLLIDSFCMRSLDVFENQAEHGGISLFSILDKTRSAAGKRLLSRELASPLTDVAEISKRQDMVEFFALNSETRVRVQGLLSKIADVERVVARARIKKASPRDLRALGITLSHLPELSGLLSAQGFIITPEPALADKLLAAIAPEAPANTNAEDFIKDGYSAVLDDFRDTSRGAKKLIADLQQKYIARTDVLSLKIKYNALFGYFVEVPSGRADKLIEDKSFRHKQTLSGAVRFATAELSELEAQILSAGAKIREMELRIFAELQAEVADKAEALFASARELAAVDFYSSLAEVAAAKRWVRPTVDESLAFEVALGRHPVVEESMRGLQAGSFVPNDALFENRAGGAKIWLLTGPNMAGKSTFLRQNALLVLLAQIGSFVPAASAHIGVVDKLFSRVGASDNLARGRSTFMVEMSEAAAILREATGRSFVILDELGRGTSTFDGVAIAWAALEDLATRIGCRGLFATHYHEIAAACARLPNVTPYSMAVKEYKGEVAFMHKVEPGSASHSYGIHVARLAGMRDSVVERAKEILAGLEESRARIGVASGEEEKDLFSYKKPDAKTAPKESALEAKLAAINPDALSPKEALEALYELKKIT